MTLNLSINMATLSTLSPCPPYFACHILPSLIPAIRINLSRELSRKRNSILLAVQMPVGYSAWCPLYRGTFERNSQFVPIPGIFTVYQAPSPTASDMMRLAWNSLGHLIRSVGNAYMLARPLAGMLSGTVNKQKVGYHHLFYSSILR